MRASAEWRPEQLSEPSPMKSPEPITINEVTVYYQKGPPKKVPIGELQIIWNTDEGLLNSVMSSSDGRYVVNLTESATLEKIDYTFRDQLKPWYELMEAGKPVDSLDYPIELSKGDGLSFSHSWSVPEDEPAAHEEFDPKIRLHFETEDGRKVIEHIPINLNLHLDEGQVKRLVRSGGDLR
jgi:hypothetical protein